MNSLTTKFVATSLFLISTVTFGLSFRMGAEQWQKTTDSERSIQAIDTLMVGSYNVENLFEAAMTPPRDGFLSFLNFADALRPIKPIGKIKDLCRAILSNRFDVLVVEEVENIETLRLLSKYYLQNLYQPFLIEGNDPRGIDVGYLIRKDLPFFIELTSNKTETWEDPTTGGEDLLFSRDLPELHVSPDADSTPLFVMFGTHFKSKISRKNDPESRILRKAQVDRSAEIMKALDENFDGKVPLFISGDFNGVVSHEKEFTAYKKTQTLFDAFDVVKPALSSADRFTHVYFPKGKPPERSQLDGFMMTGNARAAVRKAFPFRYVDSAGNVLPIPNTYQEKEKNPSDHYPVVVELDMKKLVN